MEKKEKINIAIEKLKSDPVRWKNITQFAHSKLTDEQRVSPVYDSFLHLKIREVLSEYI